MADMQKEIDSLQDLYLNGHTDEELKQAQEKVKGLFAKMDTPNDIVTLYKFLPAQATVPFLPKVLELEREQLSNTDISKTVKDTIMSLDFPSTDLKKASLLALYQCLAKKGDSQAAQTALIQYLSLFDGAGSAETEKYATEAVLGQLKSGMVMEQEPQTWQFETVFSLEPVKGLKGSKNAECGALYTLVHDLVAKGDVRGLAAFVKKNGAMVEKWGVDAGELTKKVRLLAICGLCREAAAVGYGAIAEKLDVDEKEVEMYVIDAMSAGLLNGKIDSMSKTVHVKSAHCPLVESGSWTELSSQLLAWYTQVSTLVTTLDDVRLQQVKEDRESERIEAHSRSK